MIQFDNTTIGEVAIHFVGNKVREDGMILSKAPVSQTEELRLALRKCCLSPFDGDESWHFTHGTDLCFNVVYNLCREVFAAPELLFDKSVDLARHLYDQCSHNRIKPGEFCAVYFRDVSLDGEPTDAIGLFKSEEKDTFLKVINLVATLNLEADKGISTKKLDKGALVFRRNEEEGYVVKVVDNTNKTDAQYWLEDFLGVASCRDEYSNTKHAMAMAKNFVTKELPKEYDISKNDQITLLGKALDYFKEKDEFDVDEFTGEVFEDKGVAEVFCRYKEQYEASNDVEIEDHFGISGSACARQQRVYKRVIKLDNNVRIYITGSREQVIQGEDEYGKFYKVYYEEEQI